MTETNDVVKPKRGPKPKIAQVDSKEQQLSQMPSIDPETKNDDETIVVEKVAESSSRQIKALVIEVRNLGLRAIFEPISKTTIAPGQTLKIECSTLSVKQSVLNNLKQFIDLGKNLEVLQND